MYLNNQREKLFYNIKYNYNLSVYRYVQLEVSRVNQFFDFYVLNYDISVKNCFTDAKFNILKYEFTTAMSQIFLMQIPVCFFNILY